MHGAAGAKIARKGASIVRARSAAACMNFCTSDLHCHCIVTNYAIRYVVPRARWAPHGTRLSVVVKLHRAKPQPTTK